MTDQSEYPNPDPSLFETIWCGNKDLKVLSSVSAELGVEDGGSIDASVVPALPRLQTLAYSAWAQLHNLQVRHYNRSDEELIDLTKFEAMFKHERDEQKKANKSK